VLTTAIAQCDSFASIDVLTSDAIASRKAVRDLPAQIA
jgi:hypothetical protein